MSPGAGGVVVDLRATQSPDHRGRGIAGYATQLALALERRRGDLVCRYLLSPDWPPPPTPGFEPLVASGKIAYAGTPGAIPQGARCYHSMSPFELSARVSDVWPREVEEQSLAFSTMAYDLIPLHFAGEYLADVRQARRYRPRLEVLRLADAVLAISETTRRDVVELLDVEAWRVTTIGTGTPDDLVPPLSTDLAEASARAALPGLRPPFVLYPAGSDGRKNVESLVRAFAGLPASLRGTHQLVIAGELPPLMANHFQVLAGELGVGSEVLLTGYVEAETLVLLYQAAALVCFPSLAEGYGLPVAEALACGAVVVASDRPPLDELVPPEARFDPLVLTSIAGVMETALTDRGFRCEASKRAAARLGLVRWDDVADRAAEVLERLCTRRRHWRRPCRLALVSPFPPVRSGVASYSVQLSAALATVLDEARKGAELVCFGDGRDREPADIEPLPDGRPTPADARRFLVEDRVNGGFEHVVYALGNSEYHAFALAALRKRKGAVLAHEVHAANLLHHSTWLAGAVPGGLEAAIRRTYDGLPGGLGQDGSISPADEERFGLVMFREIASEASQVFLTSEAARRLAALDAGPDLEGRLGVVPFAIALPEDELAVIEAARARRSVPGGEAAGDADAGGAGGDAAGPRGGDAAGPRGGDAAGPWDGDAGPPGYASAPPVLGSFGIVDPAKCPEVLLAAADLLSRRGLPVRLWFVGPVSDEVRAALEAQAEALGLQGRLLITGLVDREDYLSYLGQVDVAVQLRKRFRGEASAAAGNCLAAGLPTVVTDVGWFADLPDDTVVKLPLAAGAETVASALFELLSDPARRDGLGRRAASHAATQTFERSAAALVAALGIGSEMESETALNAGGARSGPASQPSARVVPLRG